MKRRSHLLRGPAVAALLPAFWGPKNNMVMLRLRMCFSERFLARGV
mgnify:CR=1 FL=1